MKKFFAVLFDLGNTLLYFDGIWPDVFAKADQEMTADLKSAGIELDEETFIPEFRKRLNAYYLERESEFVEHTTAYVLRVLLDELGHKDFQDETLAPALQRMYAVSQTHWHAEEDAINCLETLQSQGYRLGIISNAADDTDVQTLVDKTNLRKYFDIVLSSAACGIRKPNPRIFEIALDHWGINPDQSAMVGDRLGADILGAKNAGVFSIWITRRADSPANKDHAATIQPDAEIESLADLPVMLANL